MPTSLTKTCQVYDAMIAEKDAEIDRLRHRNAKLWVALKDIAEIRSAADVACKALAEDEQ